MNVSTKHIPIKLIIACSILVFFLGISLFSVNVDYTTQNLEQRFLPPSWMEGGSVEHLLGTDYLGRDLAARIISGIRISYLIALAGTIIGTIIGTFLGYLAARFRGVIDEIIMMLVDVQASLPFMIIAIALLSIFTNSLLVIIILLGVAGWEKYARLTRGMTLSAMNDGYSVAVLVLGASQGRVFFRHILPNISSALIVNMSLNFPGTMIAESSLSFLGLGIQPPIVSLGRLLGEGRVYLLTAWWITVFPGLVIFLSTLSMTLIGDWIRDRLHAST
ncbi:MAG: ABC transporter permease [Sphaerochaetaceae bacterium]